MFYPLHFVVRPGNEVYAQVCNGTVGVSDMPDATVPPQFVGPRLQGYKSPTLSDGTDKTYLTEALNFEGNVL